MPELPEVETVRRVLESWLLHRKIIGVKVYYPPILRNRTADEFQQHLIGEEFKAIERKGKWLILKTSQYTLISHLRMEGKYYLGHYPNSTTCQSGMVFHVDQQDRFSKHVHVVFELDNGTLLLYHDVRKFGRMSLHIKEEYLQDEAFSQLGEEPFSMENAHDLYQSMHTKRASIKQLLLNQHLLSGLGNIYADEVLFLSKVDPRTPGNQLHYQQFETILHQAKMVLSQAIEQGGTTIRSYHSSHFVDGKFQQSLYVYGREGKGCLVCNTPIVKMVVAQRGTHFCPLCQRKEVQHPVRILGITGVIGSGKSTVSHLFSTHGWKILDADAFAKQALDNGTSAYQQVVRHFGKAILQADGKIDRAQLRNLVAADHSQLKFLEGIIHPYVIETTKAFIQQKPGRYLLDVPLLFESKMNELCDATLYVHTEEKCRKKRLIERGTMSIQAADDLNKNTWTIQQKMQHSDFIIDNSHTLQVTKEQVESLQNYLCKKKGFVL